MDARGRRYAHVLRHAAVGHLTLEAEDVLNLAHSVLAGRAVTTAIARNDLFRDHLWMQIIADVTGRAVYTIEQEVEAAMGAALLAAYGVALISAADVQRGWLTLKLRARPRLRCSEIYDRLFGTCKSLYPALKATIHDLHDRAIAIRESPPVRR